MLSIDVRPGELIFSESDSADCAYLVEKGRVEIYRDGSGSRQSLSLIGPGQIFGEMGLIDGLPRSASAVATQTSRLLCITHAEFQAMLGRAEPFHAELLVKLVSRFRESQRTWMEGGRLPRIENSPMGPGYTALARHRDISDALESDRIVPYLQPIVDLASGRWRGFEALARWRSADDGVLTPDQFLPLAERTGLIKQIDLVIAAQAMTAVRSIEGPEAPYLHLNFSAWHFCDDGLPGMVAGLIDKTGLPPSRLRIELTETLMLGDPDKALQIMNSLAEMGLQLALDDFGTGYSSLNVLHRMPIHILKIDRSLVAGLMSDERRRHVLRNVVALAGDLHMDVVPEGIEDAEAAAALMSLGCTSGQGFFFARPLPADQAIEKWREGSGATGGTLLPTS